MWWVNTAMWDLADIGALIAPRPLLIASANQDGIFPIRRHPRSPLAAGRSCIARSASPRISGSSKRRAAIRITSDRARPSSRGSSSTSRPKTWRPPRSETSRPTPARLETEETLRVYSAGSPAGNRALTIQDELITLASPPTLNRQRPASRRSRKQVVEKLRGDTFNHFPRTPPRLDIDEEFALDGGVGTRFAFTSEDGWRLHGLRRNPPHAQGPAPAVVVLRSPGEARNDSDTFADSIRMAVDHARRGDPRHR